MATHASVSSSIEADSAPTDDTVRHHRREEEQYRRRHRRALVRDLDRPGIEQVAQQCQEPSVPELLRLCEGDGPLSADDLRRIGRGLANSAAARAACTQTGDWRRRLQAIVDRLTGDDPECQLEAAVCITNLAAGPVTTELTGVVGGYLVTLCGSSSHRLQEQCVWALGNLAASGAPVCALLAAQGLPAAAVSCLKSVQGAVREAAAAALAVFLTHAGAGDTGALPAELLPLLSPLLSLDSPGACFCLSAAAASPAADSLLAAAPTELLSSVSDLLLRAAVTADPSQTELRCLTHLLRALTHLVLTPGAAAVALRQPCAVRLLSALLRHRRRHVRRETLILVANLLSEERGEEAKMAAEEAGLPARLAPLLEEAYRMI
ncbi:importin subunit alpha-like [Amphibalanus amphitrite]|uniref:importin subunit alpha-like n=1 Tax=Amphibalanus amphitrite TaxID=1232801 RepID=UPI001C9145C8|nr:importin subunit alpha-like [Amphibalanus amphitrite]XP_043224373.1 importin subunit alpha-like [Amphibalanus amphitrite]XP_043224378.1 importin subunit alpha-like [Amphibalanus amphitrite]XP_043224388.1 importin subunit alpha-like [Amphibalanus amphitrite]